MTGDRDPDREAILRTLERHKVRYDLSEHHANTSGL
jgi:hypothetical protein